MTHRAIRRVAFLTLLLSLSTIASAQTPVPPHSPTPKSEAGSEDGPYGGFVRDLICDAFGPITCLLLGDPLGFIVSLIASAVSAPLLFMRNGIAIVLGMGATAINSFWSMIGSAFATIGRILVDAVTASPRTLQAVHRFNTLLQETAEAHGPLAPFVLSLLYLILLSILFTVAYLIGRIARAVITRDPRQLLR